MDSLEEQINKEFVDGVDKAVIQVLLHPELEEVKVKRPPMKIQVTITKEISRCYHECPYFQLDGGPGPVMYCAHPTFKGYEGFIISHPDCDDGFPEKCPLLKENQK